VVLIVLLGAAALAGCVAGLAAARWPAVDPARAVGAAAREVSKHGGRLRRFLRARIDAGTATGLGLTLAVVGIVVGGTLLGLLAFLVRSSHTGLVGVDRSAAVWGAQHATSLSTFLVRGITQLGATVTIVVVGVALAVVEYRRIPSRSMPLFLLLVVIGQLVIVNVIKVAVARVRPDIDPLAGFTGKSFPSGHTTAAAAFYAASAMVASRGRSLRIRATLVGVAVGIAVAVGASRVLLGVHWFSDVIAGLALGWSWFAICATAFGGRLLRFGAPVEAAQAAAGGEQRDPPVSPPPERGYPSDQGSARSA
jgi:undecaprenyl-diphosphatase